MVKFDDYKDLRKTFDYDKDKTVRLAQAINEVVELKKRIAYLEKLVDDNTELHPFIWRTAENKAIALHEIEDSHLENVIRYMARNERYIKDEIVAEAESRGMDVDTLKMQSPILSPGEVLFNDPTPLDDDYELFEVE